MKYIDADKLIAEIGRRLKIVEPHKDTFESAAACRQELIWMKDFITSLQQEQPEVDLEKELKKCQEHYILVKEKGFSLDWMDIETTARHFYELGLNARKEESK